MKEELGHCSVNQYRYILRNKRHQSPCNPFPIPFAWGCSGVHRCDGERARILAARPHHCQPTTSDHRPPLYEASCHPPGLHLFPALPDSAAPLQPPSPNPVDVATSLMVPACVTPNIRDLHYLCVNQILSSSPSETCLPTKIKQEGMMWFPMPPMPTFAILLHA